MLTASANIVDIYFCEYAWQSHYTVTSQDRTAVWAKQQDTCKVH